jgi:hypothetical protein
MILRAAAVAAALALVPSAATAETAPRPIGPTQGATVAPAAPGRPAELVVQVLVAARSDPGDLTLRVLVSRASTLDSSGALAEPVLKQDVAVIPPGSASGEHTGTLRLAAVGTYVWQPVLVGARGEVVAAGAGRTFDVLGASSDLPATPAPTTTPPAGAPPARGAAGGPTGFSARLTEVVRRARPSVVRVTAVGRSRVTVGSGFVVAPRLIGTNAHVIAGARSVRVATESGRGVVATIVETDPDRDLALLRLPRDLRRPPLRFAPSVRLGSEIAALGFPYGASFRAPAGRVREELTSRRAGTRRLRNLIETSAPLYPGSSGGPVLDLAGRVVGVVVAGQLGVVGGGGPNPEGTSFAIATSTAGPTFRRWMEEAPGATP